MEISTASPAQTSYNHDLRLSDPVLADGRVLQLHLTGVLDGINANTFVDAFTAALDQDDQAPAEIVDLKVDGLRFLDSAGIRALLRCRRITDRSGRRLRLRDPAPAGLQVLTITGLLSHLDIQI